MYNARYQTKHMSLLNLCVDNRTGIPVLADLQCSLPAV
jgi:hypothetical protein